MSSPPPSDNLQRARQRVANVSADQPCRARNVGCAVCTAPVEATPSCAHCSRHRSADQMLADLVAPLAYAWEGDSQLGRDVYNYKRVSGQLAAAALGNLAALVYCFSHRHAACPASLEPQ